MHDIFSNALFLGLSFASDHGGMMQNAGFLPALQQVFLGIFG